MSISFQNIHDHSTDIDKFRMKWRFNDTKYDELLREHLDQLKPLDNMASKFLWKYIADTELHKDVPFKKDYFQVIDKAKVSDDNEKEIKKWLYQRGLKFDHQVYLSWSPDDAMIVPWKLLIKYFSSFYYSGSDDLTVIDQSLNWALLFYHENEIYFGTNEKYKPSESFANIDFIW
jgi:hypothetical protein